LHDGCRIIASARTLCAHSIFIGTGRLRTVFKRAFYRSLSPQQFLVAEQPHPLYIARDLPGNMDASSQRQFAGRRQREVADLGQVGVRFDVHRDRAGFLHAVAHHAQVVGRGCVWNGGLTALRLDTPVLPVLSAW